MAPRASDAQRRDCAYMLQAVAEGGALALQYASAQLTAMVASLRRNLVQIDDARLRTFARLCDASGQPPVAPDAVTFFLRALHYSLTLRAGNTAHFPKDAVFLLSLERCLAVIRELFGGYGEDDPRPEAEERLRVTLIGMGQGKGEFIF